MKLATTNLLMIIIAAAVLIMMLAITGVFQMTATDNTNTCAASVAIRAGAIASNTPNDAPLHGCTTEQETLDGSEEEVRKELTQAYSRCRYMFGPAANQQLVRNTATYCHVCGIYDITEVESISRIDETILVAAKEEGWYSRFLTETMDAQEVISTQEPVAVVFVQDTSLDHNLFTWFLNPIRSRSSVFGLLMSSPDADVMSGIIIREYGPELIEQAGCTTIDPLQR